MAGLLLSTSMDRPGGDGEPPLLYGVAERRRDDHQAGSVRTPNRPARIEVEYIMGDLASSLVKTLNSLPVSKWGIGDISGLHPLSDEYPKAISLLVAYTPAFRHYDERGFDSILTQALEEMHSHREALRSALDDMDIKHLVASWPMDEQTLTAGFSNKLAATRAGLGWIGKNCLLVTDEYGPRVRLATVLIDADVPCAEPVTVSGCGACRVCVDACPYGCLTGADWYPGMARDALLDAFGCLAERNKFVESIGHRHACGYCLLSCPRGRGSLDVTVGPGSQPPDKLRLGCRRRFL